MNLLIVRRNCTHKIATGKKTFLEPLVLLLGFCRYVRVKIGQLRPLFGFLNHNFLQQINMNKFPGTRIQTHNPSMSLQPQPPAPNY